MTDTATNVPDAVLPVPKKLTIYDIGNKPSLPRKPGDASALLIATIPQLANPITSQLSYGRKAVPNLINDLKSTKLLQQQRALVCLTELFHSTQNISQAISENIIEYLIGFLPSDNITCRQKATEALMILSTHSIGRNAILSERSNIIKMAKIFNDHDDLVRKHIHETFSMITTEPQGTLIKYLTLGVILVLEGRFFEVLISKVTNERLDVQVHILNTVYNCLRLGPETFMPETAIESKTLEVITRVAEHSAIVEVQVAACQCIMMLCFYHECKRLACSLNTITVIADLLSHVNASIRAAASGALMSISIDCDAKRILVREHVVKVLSKLLDDDNELVQLNSIKAITNCAEEYRGRFQLHQSLDKV
ncbi:Radial spoke head 14 [Globomyces sp. JEL0801]|nr:Radial spoke head 14 [Globomyces sp. JEL0801]